MIESTTTQPDLVAEQDFGVWIKRFAVLFFLAAFLGFFALGTTPQSSLLGDWMYFDLNQNVVHLALAAVLLSLHVFGNRRAMQLGIGLVALLCLVAAVYSIFAASMSAPNAWVVNLEFPLEGLFYAAIGLLAAWIALMPAGPILVNSDSK